MNRQRLGKWLLRGFGGLPMAAGLALAGFAGPPALAAERATNAVIEEVTVTARKREERVIDTPVAVSVLTQEEIERYNTRDLAQLTQRIPGVSIAHAAGGGAGGNMVIRGVGPLSSLVSSFLSLPPSLSPSLSLFTPLYFNLLSFLLFPLSPRVPMAWCKFMRRDSGS